MNFVDRYPVSPTSFSPSRVLTGMTALVRPVFLHCYRHVSSQILPDRTYSDLFPGLLATATRSPSSSAGRSSSSMYQHGHTRLFMADTTFSSLFYIPGTLAGAFVVDYLGPKWTMVGPFVSHSKSYLELDADHRSPLASGHWLHHEWSLYEIDKPHRRIRRTLLRRFHIVAPH